MNITEQTFPIADDLAENIIGLSATFNGVECHNKGGWQGNISEDYPSWAIELVNSLQSYFPGYKVHGAWFNVNKPGDKNIMHRHYINGTTGVLYIKVPENSGRVVFQKNKEFRYLLPKPGTLLTFPGDLMHMVEENKSQETRVSMAFNLVQC